MVFLGCFRRRRDPSPLSGKSGLEGEDASSKSHSKSGNHSQSKPDNRSNNKINNTLNDGASTKLKLAPRSTAILHTPKQEVGTRISEANVARINPSSSLEANQLPSAKVNNNDRNVSSGEPTVSTSMETPNTTSLPLAATTAVGPSSSSSPPSTEPSTIVESTNRLSTMGDSALPRPSANPLLGLNASQSEEFKAILAKRAARKNQNLSDQPIQ